MLLLRTSVTLSAADDSLGAQREIIRASLDGIANNVGMALRDAGLTCPVNRPQFWGNRSQLSPRRLMHLMEIGRV